MVHFAKWKTWLTLAILAAGIIFAAPNLLTAEQADAIPRWLPHKQISLGLDLQGGSHLLYEVDVDAAITEQLEAMKDAVRDVLRSAKVKYRGLRVSGHSACAKLLDPATVDSVREPIQRIAGDLTLTADSEGNICLELSDPVAIARAQDALSRSIEIIRNRIDEKGVKEPTIIRQGTDRIIVQLPGVKNPEELKAVIGTTAKMTFHFVADSVTQDSAETVEFPSDEGAPVRVEKRVMVSGENLVDAQLGFDESGRAVVNFKFDTIGAKKFGNATSGGVGRLFAIVLDGRVISAPVIREPILGGSGQISGNFTADSAKQLALLLRAGALPAPLEIMEERTVGAELGSDSIAAGKTASVMGLVLICVALVAVYGLFGIFANIALVFNFVLLIAVMSAIEATLTLPGIAGMVLTLGMAVDANVLIHERIREEIRAGRGPVMAIDAGYRSAAGTITDSNLTVIISSLCLLIFGSGTVRGFAVTLMIGTIISMFTAVVVARLCTILWLRQMRPQALPI